MSDLEVRAVPDSDLDKAIELTNFVFHNRQKDKDDRDRVRRWLGRTERIGAYDGDRLVGLLAVLPKRISMPGGDLSCAAVTAVGVLPTHRRRGILTALIDRLWADSLAAGRPVAALWASEGAIYGRFGFGSATRLREVRIPTVKPLALRVEPGPRTFRLISPEQAPEIINPLYERARTRRGGMLDRDGEWWDQDKLRDEDPEDGRLTSPRIVILDGEPGGYALFRTGEENHVGKVHLAELEADTPEAELALWRFLASVDLTDEIRCWSRPPDDTLLAASADTDQYRVVKEEHALWLRLVDLRAALEARSWATSADLVIEVRDDALPAGRGRWRLRTGQEKATCERTDDPADLTLDQRDLAGAYLGGGTPVRVLVRTGLATEHTLGAALSLDTALTTEYGPHLTDDF
jgi:predicted acetyltransferase